MKWWGGPHQNQNSDSKLILREKEFTDLENIYKSYICVEEVEDYMKKSQLAMNKNLTAKKYNRSLPREGMLGTESS